MESGIDFRGREWTRNDSPMPADKDLTGQQFEALTVLFRVQNHNGGTSQWLCQCACGNQVVIKGTALRSKHSGSCGCLRRVKQSLALRRDIEPGTQFGYWTVLGRADTGTGRGSFWNARCTCGAERTVSAQSLLNGRSSSCGCYHKEATSERFMIDIIGERRGQLTITRGPVEKRGTQLYWEAACDCGNKVIIDGHSFRRGAVASCGCTRLSSGEIVISSLLDSADVIYQREFTFDDLVGDTGRRLRYDFALIDDAGRVTRLIEFDGEQHYKAVDKFGGEALLQKLQRYDHTKNIYALEHNIPLVRIPYNKLGSIDVDSLLGKEFLIA